jgi:hypothetical protein
MPATAHRFTERTVAPIGRVDKAAGVIHDVRIIGTKSRNRRTYTHDALQAAAPRYEGVHVNVNHPKSSEMSEDRQFDDWAGVLENVRYRDGALYGDLRLRRESKWFSQVIEAAERFPQSFGLSHVADGDSRLIGGEEVVESIESVFSVDIVLNPAANRGLFESVDDFGASDVSLTNCGDRITEMTEKLAALAATSSGMVPQELLSTCVNVAAVAMAIQLNELKSANATYGESRRTSFAKRQSEAAGSLSERITPTQANRSDDRSTELTDDIIRAFGNRKSSDEELQRFANRLR